VHTKNVVTFSKFAVHRKSLNRSEHRTGHHFEGRTAAEDVGKPSSRPLRDLVTRWSWSRGCRHFLSFVFGVDACFVFDFVVFYLWINSDNITRWQSRHTGWFQIPHLGSCPPASIDRKISLISSAKCLVSLIREPVFFQIYTASSEFGFKLIVFFFRKCMRILFTDRALPTIRRMDKILGKVSPSPYGPKITVAYGELRVYFADQIPPFIDWTWKVEMTLSLQVDLMLSDAASTSEA